MSIDRNDDLQHIMDDPRTIIYIDMADQHLERIGYTEHGRKHAEFVSQRAGYILEKLGFPEKSIRLAAIAGYLHDLGNLISRNNHGFSSAFLAKDILAENGFSIEDTALIMSAIGNHEDNGGEITSEITAAIIIADKTHVHRSRVRNKNFITFDIHDRVNYAVTESKIDINSAKKEIILNLVIDTEISEVVEYFEIFLSRMLLCKRAAEYLETKFSMFINNVKLI
jgi:metal-dependent HD superfamily phosphatase/phosphodiesterase